MATFAAFAADPAPLAAAVRGIGWVWFPDLAEADTRYPQTSALRPDFLVVGVEAGRTTRHAAAFRFLDVLSAVGTPPHPAPRVAVYDLARNFAVTALVAALCPQAARGYPTLWVSRLNLVHTAGAPGYADPPLLGDWAAREYAAAVMGIDRAAAHACTGVPAAECQGCGAVFDAWQPAANGTIDVAPDDPGAPFRRAYACYACLDRMDADMWVSAACWRQLAPRVPFEALRITK